MLHFTYNAITHIRIERAIALLLWTMLATALCAYGYFIVSSVVNVMLRQELMVSIQNAEAKVSHLESEYLERTGTISATRIAEVGLVDIATVTYVPLATDEDRLSRLP